MGDYDYIEEIIIELGVEIYVYFVVVKLGKLLIVVSFFNIKCLYFGLLGNFVLVLVSFWWFV